MLSKTLLAATALTGSAIASAHIRNAEHAGLNRRAMETDWVTVTSTVWVDGAATEVTSVSAVSTESVPTTVAAITTPTASTLATVVSSVASEAASVVSAGAAAATSVAAAAAATTTSATTSAVSTTEAAVAAEAYAATTTSSAKTSSTSATSTTTASTSSSTSSSSKRGLAYNDAALLDPFFDQRSFSWVYNWGSSAGSVSSSSAEYVPMLWGSSSTYTDGWSSAVETALEGGSTHLLAFNEPDISSQSNLTPDEAAAAYVTYMNPYASSAKLGSPATSNSNVDGEGNSWLKEFISACDSAGCTVDFCVTHWYSTYDDTDSLFTHLEEVHEICGDDREIWLTEFAPNSATTDESVTFLGDVLDRLDSLSYLGRYSFFYVAVPNMLESSTSLNSIGSAYV